MKDYACTVYSNRDGGTEQGSCSDDGRGADTKLEVYEPLSFNLFFLSLHTQEIVLDGNFHVHIKAYGIAEHVSFGEKKMENLLFFFV